MNELEKSILKLTETVHLLAEATARNERHCRSLENNLKWVGVLTLVVMVFYLGSNMKAQAVPSNLEAKLEKVEANLKVLTLGGAVFEELSKQMSLPLEQTSQKMAEQIANMIIFVSFLGEAMSKQMTLKMAKQDETLNGLLAKRPPSPSPQTPPPLAQQIQYRMAELMAEKVITTPWPKLASFIDDLATLVHRVRLDSDALRKSLNVGEGSGLLNNREMDTIQETLRVLHADLRIIPTMAADMHQMNLKMGLMTHDIDATMGRAGRMMPGWWW
jgi:hypothetical protein